MLVFLGAWQKAKADISFLEGKVADFIHREKRLSLEIEELKTKEAARNSSSLSVQSDNVVGEHLESSYQKLFGFLALHDKKTMKSVCKNLQMVELDDASLAFLHKLSGKSVVSISKDEEN